MTNRHRLIYTIWGVIGALLVYIPDHAHAILPLIPMRYQAAFSALVAFLVTIRALNMTPPEVKSPPQILPPVSPVAPPEAISETSATLVTPATPATPEKGEPQ